MIEQFTIRYADINEDIMNIVSFGGGVNSTAMILLMHEKGIDIDIISFSDTGGEKPETYAHISAFNKYLLAQGYVGITIISRNSKCYPTLEEYCLYRKRMPGLVVGRRDCSFDYKVTPHKVFCNRNIACKAVWKDNRRVNSFIGFDASEPHRAERRKEKDAADMKYLYHYPLIEWGVGRKECQDVVEKYGFTNVPKSSCFFCPAMKKKEIVALRKQHPDLYLRSLAIERNALTAGTYRDTVKGLGRNYAWESVTADEQSSPQYVGDIPCECVD